MLLFARCGKDTLMADKRKKKVPVPEDVVYAMRLIIGWNTLHTLCLSRTSCIGCPYWSDKTCETMTCEKKSTEQTIQDSAEIFRFFLDQYKD